MKRSSPLMHAVSRQLRAFALVLLAYLLQMSVMPELQLADVTPNLMFVMVAVITVCYGRLRAFWIGAFYGVIMEVMQPTRELFSLLIFPVAALLGAVLFADKSTRQLEYERSLGRSGRNITPYLRMPLCTLVNVFVYELINVTYIYLREGAIDSGHIGRALLNIGLTTAISIVLMLPLRRLLGFRHRKPEPETPRLY